MEERINFDFNEVFSKRVQAQKNNLEMVKN
jgi:hypothetical protein